MKYEHRNTTIYNVSWETETPSSTATGGRCGATYRVRFNPAVVSRAPFIKHTSAAREVHALFKISSQS